MIKILETENKDVKKEYDVMPEGAYEVFVDRVDAPEDMGDIEKTGIMFRVRDDVDGDFKNRTIFTNITTAPNMGWKLSNIARAAGVPAGTDFKNLTSYATAIQGKSLKVLVAHREYNGKTYVDAKAFYPTRLPAYRGKAADLDII
jgi:hypothetical protein